MTTKYVVKVDVTGKQEYIFSSNRLKEVIGASEIVRFVTQDLGWIILSKLEYEKEVGFKAQWYDGQLGNVLFLGGGNGTYIFNTVDQAKLFINRMSDLCIEYFDGLKLLMVYEAYDPEDVNLPEIIENLDISLRKKKDAAFGMLQRTGFGMTEICPNTGKAAGYRIYLKDKDKEENYKDKYYSKETLGKMMFYIIINEKEESDYLDEVKIPAKKFKMSLSLDEQNPLETEYFIKRYRIHSKTDQSNEVFKTDYESWKSVHVKFDEMPLEQLKKCDVSVEMYEAINSNVKKFTTELDYIGGISKSIGFPSYIGIGCLDGNGFGEVFRKFKNANRELEESKFINKYRELSAVIDSFFYIMLENITKIVIERVSINYKEILSNSSDHTKADNYLGEIKMNGIPFRPVIVAGDDLTLIAEGGYIIDMSRLMLDMMPEILDDYRWIVGDIIDELGASIGISIIGKKYPFSRAVEVAENVQKDIKELIVASKCNQGVESYKIISGMGWELDRGELSNKEVTTNVFSRMYFNESKKNPPRRAFKTLESTKNNPPANIYDDKLKSMFNFNKEGKLSKGKMVNYFKSQQISEEAANLFMIKYRTESPELKDLGIDNIIDAIELSGFLNRLKGGK